MLGACSTGGNTSTPSSSSESSSSESSSSELDLYGFDLKKTEDICANATYNLADQINLHPGVSLSDLSFMVAQRSEPIATVDANGLLTRVRYGSTQVTVYRKSTPVFDKSFTIHFFPTPDAQIGTFSAQLSAAEGHEDNRVTVTIQTKANNKFSISYTAGWLSVDNGDDTKTNYQIANAIEAEGDFELEGSLKFTVTTESFALKKRFGGRLDFDGSNPFIFTRVPVAEDRTSDRVNLLKATA